MRVREACAKLDPGTGFGIPAVVAERQRERRGQRRLAHPQPPARLELAPHPAGPRIARRMIIENTIADAIDFFHMDALSAAVPLKIDVDVQLTVMASALYRILAARLGDGLDTQKPGTLFRKLVKASATIDITPTDIVVTLGRRAYTPTCSRPASLNARPLSRGSTIAASTSDSPEPTMSLPTTRMGIEV